MRIKEAGVAGVVLWPLRWAMIAGEAARELGLGGGRISDNRGSGEIESVSELSRLSGTSKPLADGRRDRASCTNSVTSLGGIKEETVAFRLFGFTIGDCRTRPLAFAGRGGFLLLVLLSLRPCSCWGISAGSPNRFMSTSMGD